MAIKSKRWMLLFWLGGIALLLRTLMPLIRWIEAAFRGAREEVPVRPSIGPARLLEGEDQALSPQQVEWAKEFREIKDGLKELLRRGGEWEKVWERYDEIFAFFLGILVSLFAEVVAQTFPLSGLVAFATLVFLAMLAIVIYARRIHLKEKAQAHLD